MEFLLRRLLAIIDRQGNHTKYQPEELYTQWALFQRDFILNIHEGSFYLACTVINYLITPA
jgi:hypothetical protein